VPDRTSAGAIPHSKPILTDGAQNLGESFLDVTVTGTAISVMLLSSTTFRSLTAVVAGNKKGANTTYCADT